MFISESTKKETDILTMDNINLEFYDHNIVILPVITLCTYSRQAKDSQTVYWEPLPLHKLVWVVIQQNLDCKFI